MWKIGIDTKVRSMVVLMSNGCFYGSGLMKQNHDAIYVETRASTPSSDLFLLYIPLKKKTCHKKYIGITIQKMLS